MMKQVAITVLLAASLALTACAKKDSPAPQEQDASAATVTEQITPEQQAVIDSIDKPVLDEKNTDVPAEVANAPADEATADSPDEATSSAVAE
ncbi:hypothetical protein [Acinetobacter sp. ASP199]|uniref:hypothetical protein n=1 Tax=unclassified Acinetobacter TaxID=196816 RepID=UPI001F622D7F|nr:hypothetical protein [Acinetobacter sp. ASP199]UNT60364.1 hypothetical protein IHE35_06045 [Acinetobacter sp. ASP199]